MIEATYKLTVMIEEPNPDYERQVEQSRSLYHSSMVGEPSRTRAVNVLDVRLTAEQWEAVKRAVLETFK